MSKDSAIEQLAKLLRGSLSKHAEADPRVATLMAIEDILRNDQALVSGLSIGVTHVCELRWPKEVEEMNAHVKAGKPAPMLIPQDEINRITREISPAVNDLYLRFMALGFLVFGHLDDILDIDQVDGKTVLRERPLLDSSDPEFAAQLRQRGAYVHTLRRVLADSRVLTTLPEFTVEMQTPDPVAT